MLYESEDEIDRGIEGASCRLLGTIQRCEQGDALQMPYETEGEIHFEIERASCQLLCMHACSRETDGKCLGHKYWTAGSCQTTGSCVRQLEAVGPRMKDYIMLLQGGARAGEFRHGKLSVSH